MRSRTTGARERRTLDARDAHERRQERDSRRTAFVVASCAYLGVLVVSPLLFIGAVHHLAGPARDFLLVAAASELAACLLGFAVASAPRDRGVVGAYGAFQAVAVVCLIGCGVAEALAGDPLGSLRVVALPVVVCGGLVHLARIELRARRRDEVNDGA